MHDDILPCITSPPPAVVPASLLNSRRSGCCFSKPHHSTFFLNNSHLQSLESSLNELFHISWWTASHFGPNLFFTIATREVPLYNLPALKKKKTQYKPSVPLSCQSTKPQHKLGTFLLWISSWHINPPCNI